MWDGAEGGKERVVEMMSFFARTGERTAAEIVDEWRQELWEALPGILGDEDGRCGMNDEGNIALKKGEATIFVDFGIDEAQGVGWVLVYSPLVSMPEDNLLPFYRKLLDINYDESVMGRLSTCDDVVFLARSLGTDFSNHRAVIEMVTALANEAAGLCDFLVKEFGARPKGFDIFAEEAGVPDPDGILGRAGRTPTPLILN